LVQKIGAQYLVKRISDYVTAPQPAEDPEQPQPAAAPPQMVAETVPDLLDGQTVRDEEGQNVGIARRVHDVSVYVIGEGFGDRVQALQDAIDDPDSKILFHSVDGRLAGIIYVPDPSKRVAKSTGMRADDV
jgi:hypothetical protein